MQARQRDRGHWVNTEHRLLAGSPGRALRTPGRADRQGVMDRALQKGLLKALLRESQAIPFGTSG